MRSWETESDDSFLILKSFEKLRPYFRKEKGHMVGFISNLAPLLNYLRRRSPGPPFPPDSRQAGERGAMTESTYF